jgi:uncharacterized protein (DUF2252 family)
MDLFTATAAYETWLRAQLPVFDADLRRKHRLMAADRFSFFRATFYRWAPIWQETCADLARAPAVLGVGDLHVENFGTWRDIEGRLVWGINDFDEAAPMPYTLDLVRLATSALLARKQDHLTVRPADACDAILDGYRRALASGGEPFVTEEEHPGLRGWAMSAERDPVQFWAKLAACPKATVPLRLRKLLAADMPARALKLQVVHRVAGLGSLGQARYAALAAWAGGQIAREAKAIRPSVYGWALGKPVTKVYGREIRARAVRCPDPFTRWVDGWLLRRLGPHCSRIELSDLPKQRDEHRLLTAMGHETANIHLGSRSAVTAVPRHLKSLDKDWLLVAARAMAKATKDEWTKWRARQR